jgi:hypothetical protein
MSWKSSRFSLISGKKKSVPIYQIQECFLYSIYPTASQLYHFCSIITLLVMARNVEELSPNYTMDTGKHWMSYIWKTFHGLYRCIFIPSRLLQMEKKSNHVSFKNVQNISSLRKLLTKIWCFDLLFVLNCCPYKIL